MITDPPPRAVKMRRQFDASDAQVSVPLPPGAPLQEASAVFAAALATGDRPAVKAAGDLILRVAAAFYDVRVPGLSVLGLRPKEVHGGHTSYELFGDYTPATGKIRIWMRTAVLGKVTSYKGLLNTLLHEFLHHLDVEKLGFQDTPHTRGFYMRLDGLYHLALGTPEGQRAPLRWIRQGNVWRIDWRAIHAAKRAIRPASTAPVPGGGGARTP